MNIVASMRAVFLVLLLFNCHTASSTDYDSSKLTVSAASLLGKDVLQGKDYKIADKVLVSGHMNHYTVDSNFGQFTAIGNRNLKKLLHEIYAIR